MKCFCQKVVQPYTCTVACVTTAFSPVQKVVPVVEDRSYEQRADERKRRPFSKVL